MAINLTTSWQNVSNATWNFSGQTIVKIYLDAKYSTQDLVNNRTTIQTRLRTELQTGYGSGNGYNFTCSYASSVSGSGLWYLATETITSGEATIQHNNDGTKTLTLNGSASISGLGVSSNLSGDVILPTIPRASKLNSASMSIASNGSSITITPNMTKNVSSYYDSLTIKNGNTTLFTLDGVTHNTAKSLSTAQINSIYSAIGTATTKTLTCYLTTYTNSSKTTTIGTSSSVNLVATLPSYSISMSVSTEDTISAYNTYKPNANTYIANISKPKFTMTTTSSTGSYYGRSVGYTLNGGNISNPYTMTNYTGQNISIVASDGRKINTQTPTMTHIAYFNPTLTTNVVRTTPTGSTIDISVSGTMYKGTGLTNLLTPTMKFKYTQSGGTEQEITIPLTLTDNNDVTSFTGTYQLTGMDYQKSVSWSAILTDRIGITANNGDTLSYGLPVFNCYRENDINYFNVNGKEIINSNGNDMILLDNDTSTTNTMIKANAKWANRSLSFGVGDGGNNAGIYDNNLNGWIIRSNKEGGGHFIGTPCTISYFPSLESSAKWFKLCNIKFDSHIQGKFAFMQIFISNGNNSADNQIAYIELAMQMGWTGNYNGRIGASALLHKLNSPLTTSNTKIKIITNTNKDYDIWVYVGYAYCRPNYIINGPSDMYVTPSSTSSSTEPSGTACSCSYQQI